MNTYTTEEKYMKVIETFGEILLNKDKTIKFKDYEIKTLKKKIERIEQYMEYYQQPTEEVTEEDYKKVLKWFIFFLINRFQKETIKNIFLRNVN